MFVRVAFHEKVKKLTCSNDAINQSTIKAAFLLPNDAIISLSYVMEGEEIACESRSIPELCFVLTDDCSSLEFHVESDKAPADARPTNPEYTLSKSKPKHNPNEYIDRVLPYLFRFQKSEGSKTEGTASGTVITKDLIATCAHVLFGLHQYTKIDPNTVLPPNDTYFYATNNEGNTFKLLLISLTIGNDLAILKVVGNKPLVSKEPKISLPLRCAFHYMIIGYSKFDGFILNKELPAKRDDGNKCAWSIVQGIVSHHINDGCYAGHGGAAPGMSGGPVLEHSNLTPNYDDFSGCPAIDLDNAGPVLFGICRGGLKGHYTGTLPIVHIIPISIILSKVAEITFNDGVKEEQSEEWDEQAAAGSAHCEGISTK